MSTPLPPIPDPQAFSPNGPAPLTLPISPTSPQSPSSPLSVSSASSGVSSPTTSSLPPQSPLSPPPHGFGVSKEGVPHYYEGYITRRSSVLKRWKKRKPYAIVPGRSPSCMVFSACEKALNHFNHDTPCMHMHVMMNTELPWSSS